jgi:hypothetical protein
VVAVTVDLYSVAGPQSPALAPEDRRLVDRVAQAVEDVAPLEDSLLENTVDLYGEDVAREQYPGRFDRYGLPELDLPGFGEPYTGEEGQIPCGTEIPHICADCGHRVDVGRTCRRSVCRRCAPAWAMQRAIGHVGRLDEAARMMSSREGYDAVYKHHVIFALPRPFLVDADEPLEEALNLIREMLDIIDAEGFVYYHPYSGSQEHEDDRGKWKKRLFQDRDWEGDVREELEMRPHFHAVVVSPHIPGGEVTKRIYDRTGIILHRVTERNGSPVSLGDLDSVARAVTYCLSHTAIDTRGAGNNRAIMRCYGSAPHDCLPLNDETVRQATGAVHTAAPDTLGLSTGSIECRAERPADEREIPEEYLGADDDGDGAGLEESSSTTESNMVPCGSELRSIDDADQFLEDEQWCTNARYVEEAREAKREWDEAGGWRAWVDWDPPPG